MKALKNLISTLIKFRQMSRIWRFAVSTLAIITVFTTTYALILPALTVDKNTVDEDPAIELKETELLDQEESIEFAEENSAVDEDNSAEDIEEVPAEETEKVSEESSISGNDSEDISIEETKGIPEVDDVSENDSEERMGEAADAETDEAGTSDIDTETEEGTSEVEYEAAAGSLSYKGHDYEIILSYDEKANLPGNAELFVEEIHEDGSGDMQAAYDVYYDKSLKAVREKMGDDVNIAFARYFDISIMYEGRELEPEDYVDVKIIYNSRSAPEVTELSEIQVVHFDSETAEAKPLTDQQNDVNVATADEKLDEVTFKTDGFSVYGIVGTETIVVDYLTANGETYTITVLFDKREMLTGNMNLYVTEILAGSEEYDGYLTDAKTAMGLCELDEFREARFFDIEITKNGEKYEPAYPATITIQCMDSVKKNKTDTLKVVHFAESGTEVISEVAISKNGTELTYEQSSFSVTGVVVSGGSSFPPDGYYILVLHSGNNYYAVGKDGSLQSVDYNENGTVTFESFTNMSQVDDYYWRQSTSASNTNRRFYINGNSYIDPFNASGVSRIARLVGLDGNRLFASLPSGTYYLGVSNGQLVGYANANNAASVLFAHGFSSTHTAVFRRNGGAGTEPPSQTVEGGETITFPENPFTKQGVVFIGWSEDNDANGSDVEHHWSAVYQPGDTFILNEDKTFYAVWSSKNVTSSFYIRLDGKIPQEPASGKDYPAAEYTKGVTIANVLKLGKFYANTAGVDSNLNSMPTADQLVAMINDSSNKLGFKVQNSGGKVVVSQITNAAKNSSNYNVSTGDELYVLWYVTKCAYPGPVLPNYNYNWWHVDGVLLVSKRVNLIYSANAPAGSFSNMPLGSQWPVGSDVIVGNDGGDNESIKQPVRNDGYNFVGWKMYTKDNDGEYTVYKGTYATHDHFTITEDTLLVAQWEKDKTSIFIIKKDQNAPTQLLDGARFKLTGFSETDGRIVESVTNENGRVSFDPIEFDTLYKLEEIEAPTGYTALESPVFFKETKVGTRMVITFYTDETGAQITDPDNRVSVSVTGTGLEINIGNVRELGKAEFLKTGESTDVKLEGAEFQLFTDITCNTATNYKSKSGADGKVSFNDIPTDTYYMKEIKAPAGYQLSNDIYQVVINKDDFTIKKVVEGSPTGDSLSTISNVHLPVEIKVYKVDESDRRALEGATFKLTRSEDGNSAYTEYPNSNNCTFSTDENGKFSVTLPKGYYRLSEITPPPGYVITTGGFDFSVSDGNVTFADLSDITFSAENKTFTVANKPGAGLPNTGGPGIYFHTLSGFTLIFTSALMYVFRKRHKERRICSIADEFVE